MPRTPSPEDDHHGNVTDDVTNETNTTGGPSDAPTNAPITTPPAETSPDSVTQTALEGRPRRRWGRTLLITATALLLLCAVVVVATWQYAGSVNRQVNRVDPFQGLAEASRPPRVTPKAMNILIVGSDTRSAKTTGSRTDTIMVAHIPAERSTVQLISIPRDTWVPIPRSADGKAGGGKARINASFAHGGTPLLVQTVEEFTTVRMDHVLMIDFAGFRKIIDALGGIDITVEKTFASIHKPHRTFAKGMQHMDGATALDYSRQRKQFIEGDFTRIEHQQQVIRAVITRAANSGLLADPFRIDDFLRSIAQTLTVDRGLSPFDLAVELKSIRDGDVTFLTSPTKGLDKINGQDVILPDTAKARELFDAVNGDRLTAWLAANPAYLR